MLRPYQWMKAHARAYCVDDVIVCAVGDRARAVVSDTMQTVKAGQTAGRRSRQLPPVDMRLRRSMRLACALAAMHVTAAAVLLATPWPWWLSVMGTAILLVHGAWVIRRHALLLASASIICVRLRNEDECELQTRAGGQVRGQVDPSSFVLPWLIVLRVAGPGRWRRRSVVLLADAVHAQELRRLRVRLRWARIGDSRRLTADAWL
jgi:toxin CptA